MTKSERCNYSKLQFWWKEPSLWEEKAKIALEISGFLTLAHAEQVFGCLGVAPNSTTDEMLPNLPAGSWKWQRDSEMSWHRCWLPWAPAATWRWWAAAAGTLSSARSCKANTSNICSGMGCKRTAQLLPMGGVMCPTTWQLEKPFGKIRAVFTSSQFPALSQQYSTA